MTRAAGVRPVKSAMQMVHVLEFLGSRPSNPARIREISDFTGIPRSSLYALLRTLLDSGWVRRDPSGSLYRVGIRALMTGVAYLDSDETIRIVKPWMDGLGQDLDETLHLGRLDGTDIVYLATKESSQYLRPINRVGRRIAASTTSLGKALLAWQPPELLDKHLIDPLPQLTANTITDRNVLERELAHTRNQGYAVDNEENTTGVKCFGFALRIEDPPVDAISCSIPLARLTPSRERIIVEKMADAIDALESRLHRSSLLPPT